MQWRKDRKLNKIHCVIVMWHNLNGWLTNQVMACSALQRICSFTNCFPHLHLSQKGRKTKIFSDILLSMHSLYIMTQHPAIPKYCRNHRVYYKAQRNDCLPKARTIILLYNINSYFLCWQILAYRSISLMVSLHSSPLSFFGINFLSASNLRHLKCI